MTPYMPEQDVNVRLASVYQPCARSAGEQYTNALLHLQKDITYKRGALANPSKNDFPGRMRGDFDA